MKNILTEDFITCNLVGRLGNLMFQMSHAYIKSIIYNRQFVVSNTESIAYNFSETLFRKIDFFLDLDPKKIDNIKELHGDFTYNFLEPKKDRPTLYEGYFQSEKFFEGYHELIRSLFSMPNDVKNQLFQEFPYLNDSVVSAINVRRGEDYAKQSSRHPLVSKDFIYSAYEELPQHDVLVVVSDNIEWCKNNIKLPKVTFMEKYDYAMALWFLSLCDHFIISNSTFSWWGSWLSRNKDKTIIAPTTWFGPDIEFDSKDIYCDDWSTIDTKYSNGEIITK